MFIPRPLNGFSWGGAADKTKTAMKRQTPSRTEIFVMGTSLMTGARVAAECRNMWTFYMQARRKSQPAG